MGSHSYHQGDSDWQQAREQRYLDAQRLIVMFFLVAVLLALLSISVTRDDTREISIAARACWDQGQRAIMHNDGEIECRD